MFERLFRTGNDITLSSVIKTRCIDINHIGNTTPLFLALNCLCLNTAELLVSYGANIDCIPEGLITKCYTTLQYAVCSDNIDIAIFFLKLGLDPEGVAYGNMAQVRTYIVVTSSSRCEMTATLLESVCQYGRGLPRWSKVVKQYEPLLPPGALGVGWNFRDLGVCMS